MKKKKKQLSKTISTTGGTKNNMHLRTKKPKSVTTAMVTKTAKTTTTTQPRKKRTTYMTKLTPHQIKQQQKEQDLLNRRKKNYQPTNKDNFNYLKNRQQSRRKQNMQTYYTNNKNVKMVVVNVPSPIKQLHDSNYIDDDNDDDGDNNNIVIMKKNTNIQKVEKNTIQTKQKSTTTSPPLPPPAPSTSNMEKPPEPPLMENTLRNNKTPSPLQGKAGEPLTYDEILQSLATYNEENMVYDNNTTMQNEEMDSDAITQNIIKNNKHLHLKQPPLPDSFEKPGDFFKYVLCEVGTPGKAPAMKKPHPKPSSSSLRPTTLRYFNQDPSSNLQQYNNDHHHNNNNIAREEKKALILKRAEELWNKRKRNKKNHLYHEHDNVNTNKKKKHNAVGGKKKKKSKRSNSKRSSSKTKVKKKRTKSKNSSSTKKHIVGNKKKKKVKKKVKKKIKKKTNQGKLQPSLNDIKNVLKRYDSTSSSNDNHTDITNINNNNYDATAIELHDLNDTQVNKLLMTSTSIVHTRKSSHDDKNVENNDDSLMIYTTKEISNDEINRHLQSNILFSTDKNHSLIKRKTKLMKDRQRYTKKEMEQFSTPPLVDDGNDKKYAKKNEKKSNSSNSNNNTFTSEDKLFKLHIEEDRDHINKSNTLYLSNNTNIINNNSHSTSSSDVGDVYDRRSRNNEANDDDNNNNNNNKTSNIFNISTILVPDTIVDNLNVVNVMKKKQTAKKAVPEWILAKENIVRENRKKNKTRKNKLIHSYSKKKKEIISKSILNMNSQTFNTKGLVTFGYPSTMMMRSKSIGVADIQDGDADEDMYNTTMRKNMKAKTIASPMYSPWNKQDNETILNRMNKLKRKQRRGRFFR